MPDDWRSLALGARRIPDDPAEDPVAQFLGRQMGPSLADRMQRLSQLQRQQFEGAGGPGKPGSEQADLGLDIAGNLTDLAGIIRAYHGSPHTFDRFDLGKMGTGEGAQVYGHGMYFAENPKVVEQYANQLPQQAWDAYNDLIGNSNYLTIGKNIYTSPEKVRYHYQMGHIKAEEIPESLREFVTKQPSTYTADLDVNPEDLLDWDLPLSQQSEKVKKSLEPFKPDLQRGINEEYITGVKSVDDMTGEDVHQTLVGMEPWNGRDRTDMTAIANRLRDAGIPGLRYLDQGSRGAGEGSRNIVMFRDDLIKLLERNGMPIGPE